VKSDAVLFEQSLDPEVIHGAFSASEKCSLMLAIGSTLGVSPANQAVVRARAAGARVVIINGSETELDHIAHIRLVGSITPILKALMDGAEFPT
jgi:NAD-dependent deacetylase